MDDDDAPPYFSLGNGSAMRVSPVAYAGEDLADVLPLARASAAVTHDHPEGIKGAQAIASAILIARQGGDTDAVARAVQAFGYDLSWSVDRWRDETTFDVTCMGTVPAATSCVLEATDLESAVRNAVWIGGDADTIAAVAGSIAGAMWGVPDALLDAITSRVDPPLVETLVQFEAWVASR
jgi:ADP-ribosylglycohydrolase